MQFSAAEFKSKCLKIMDGVNLYHEVIVITKRGKPVAKLVPYSENPEKSVFGYMKDSVQIKWAHPFFVGKFSSLVSLL